MESVNISQTSRGICIGFKSVDDVEWLCLTFLKVLKDEQIVSEEWNEMARQTRNFEIASIGRKTNFSENTIYADKINAQRRADVC